MPQERGPLQGQLFTHPHSHSSPLLCLHWSTASPLVYSIFITSPSAVGDKLRLDSGPNVCSANVTGQISVTPANIFKLLPRGYRGRWVVLEMIGLTLRDANHSWKGDSTFGCYLPGESRGKKNTSELNYGAFWSLMQTGCGKCVWAPHISEWYWREKHVAESSHAISASTLWPFCAFQLTYKLSFHERLGEERLTAPLLSCACARKRWIFEATPGCVLRRQHLTGLKWSQRRYESRQCLSKPGNNQPPPSTSGAHLKVISPKQCAASTVSLKNNNCNNT